MRRYSSVCVVALGIVGAGTATAATDTAAQEDYVITDLGAGFKPRSISENGHIVGEDSDRSARRLSTTYTSTTTATSPSRWRKTFRWRHRHKPGR